MFKFTRVILGAAIIGFCILSISEVSFAKSNPASTFEYNGPAISFEDVFQNPDDNELKLNYARQQASQGDYVSAAFALEGMLYTTPNWDSARLFYAILLAELDDHDGALYEFQILKDRPLSAEHSSIAKAYLKKLSGE